MDKAMSGKIGKKWAAILAGCIWAIFALAASVAFRTVTADALSINDVITVKAKLDPSIEGSEDGEHTWGKFYRGITLLTTANYKMDGVQSSVSIDTSGDPTVSIDVTDSSSPLNPSGHEHDFISGVPKDKNDHWESTTNGHYAVCSDSSCGFRLEVAHRPALDGSGKCADCGAPLGDYPNTYTFSGIPDYITNTKDMTGDVVSFDDYGVATFTISFEANLFLGSKLTLYLECEKGKLTDTISYTISVSLSSGEGTVISSFDTTNTEPQAIWWYTAPTEYNGESVMTAISGTITVELRLSITESPYAGTYSDTLTFSAALGERGNV